MLFRYRARNYPDSLAPGEQMQWQAHCRQRLLGELPGAGVSIAEFDRLLSAGEIPVPADLQLTLRAYATELAERFGLKYGTD